MDRRQATLADLVTLWPIFDVCAGDTGYEVGGRLQMPCWRKEAVYNQLRVTVEAISEASRVQRRQESGWSVGSEGGSEGGIMDSEG